MLYVLRLGEKRVRLQPDDEAANPADRRDSTAARAGPRRPGGAVVIIRTQGERASRRFIEFFTATIRSCDIGWHTRAVKQFFDWCDDGDGTKHTLSS